MKKKAIIFDCFGVVGSGVLTSWLLKNLGSKSNFDSVSLFKKFDLDEISEEDVAIEFTKLAERPSRVKQEEIDSSFKMNGELVAYIKQLKSKGYTIILLTNANHAFFERFIFVEYPWFQGLFDDIVISSKVKMIKPNKDIYFHTLDKNGLRSQDVIFIDDNKSNVLGAEKIGIKSILFKDTEQLKAELVKYGIS